MQSLKRFSLHTSKLEHFFKQPTRTINTSIVPIATMTTATFRYADPSASQSATGPFIKPWSKVDTPATSYTLSPHQKPVHNIRGHEADYSTDTSGFAVHHSPATEKDFTDDAAIRTSYYPQVEALLRTHLHGKASGDGPVKKVVIFDHTIRRRTRDAARQPVQLVHIDQTPKAAETRVRRHVTDSTEVEALLKGRWQIVNVWRPIANPATDFPLAVVDWRSTTEKDLIAVDLLYPKRDQDADDGDDRGKEVLPDPEKKMSTEGYEAKGETYAVAPSDAHKLFYMKDMTPDEVMLLKCFDSRGQGLEGGVEGLARHTPHTAFEDPQTPEDAPGRQSIEVRCLVFYE